MNSNQKKNAPYNRTLKLSSEDIRNLSPLLFKINSKSKIHEIENRILNQNLFEAIDYLPEKFVDLLFIDPPYNLNKKFSSINFRKKSLSDYKEWLENWFVKLLPTLKPEASVYFCSDWFTSVAVFDVLNKYLKVKNRITWEREKGRGSAKNWKNCHEDIWFCTVSENYYFNTDAVKLKRKVIAPYRDNNKNPKDWISEGKGNYRLTHPSNIWTDLTIPFWSMPENTEHPTQKPEKLLAKIILASSREGDFVFDPFCGVGTSLVVAKKLNRKFCGIELEKKYALLSLKRLALAENDKSIQGYSDGVFWERNTLREQLINKKSK
ncbi:DNA modification methylase [Ignavibacterium album JCM 16511]|uniref:Methyltransferase n=1 Tax=Ignavibacterium album (strain DSM 19864 / JCM 16511 / NBRC 101810 / Mat9-16) TaxID=945713 RepID=I0AIQ9_IGNAJ|nr:site-specific DNA-methyltransferase [Ignavibacterium album]AFH48866.1 DNA modification methylase [Ignavibacterium album JCM 16511]